MPHAPAAIITSVSAKQLPVASRKSTPPGRTRSSWAPRGRRCRERSNERRVRDFVGQARERVHVRHEPRAAASSVPRSSSAVDPRRGPSRRHAPDPAAMEPRRNDLRDRLEVRAGSFDSFSASARTSAGKFAFADESARREEALRPLRAARSGSRRRASSAPPSSRHHAVM